jgi:hypothetical protein
MTFTHTGPGPFITRRITALRLEDGQHLVATSRRHRKGLAPRIVPRAEITAPHVTRRDAWLHVWAPRRLAWWIALLFFVGSALFLLGGVATSFPHAMPPALREPAVVGWIFFVGSLFFTSAAYLQWLEAINGDVTERPEGDAPRRWRWFGWRPRNLGFLAAGIQLVGTIFFNFNTADAMSAAAELHWREEDVLVWTPNMLGSICFLVSSYFAYLEVAHGHLLTEPRAGVGCGRNTRAACPVTRRRRRRCPRR